VGVIFLFVIIFAVVCWQAKRMDRKRVAALKAEATYEGYQRDMNVSPQPGTYPQESMAEVGR
jgi:hypothetical protein